MPRTFVPDENEETAWSVAVVDDHDVRGEINARWIADAYECQLITDPEATLDHLDRRTLVACVWSAIEADTDVVRSLWEVYPHVQILTLLPRKRAPASGRDTDEHLREPFGRDDLGDMVSRLVERGLYSFKVRQYYHLSSYLASEEKYAAAFGDEQDLETLEERVDALRSEIRSLAMRLDPDDLQAVLRTIRVRKRALEQPTMAADYESGSKYHPSNCPSCGLSWGVAHGGSLGRGYTRVAAMVWKCNGCDDVLKLSPGEYDLVL